MLADLIPKLAGMDQQDWGYKPRPSNAGPERCLRQMVYERIEQPKDKPRPGRSFLVLDDSSWHETLTADWIGKSAFTLHSQQMGFSLRGALKWRPSKAYQCSICGDPVSMQDMHGHIDGLLTDPLQVDRLWEMKALNHFTCERYNKTEEFPEDYFAQCAIYLRGLHELLPELREALLLIKNKNSSQYLEYLLDYDFGADLLTIKNLVRSSGEPTVFDGQLAQVRPSIVEKCLDKFKAVEKHAIDGTLPERPFEPDDWHCSYCAYQDTCWGSYIDEVRRYRKAEEGEALDGVIAELVRLYRDAKDLENEKGKEAEKLRAAIIMRLREHQIKYAMVGDFNVTLTVSGQKRIQWDEVPGVIQAELEKCKGLIPTERLTVKEVKS